MGEARLQSTVRKQLTEEQEENSQGRVRLTTTSPPRPTHKGGVSPGLTGSSYHGPPSSPQFLFHPTHAKDFHRELSKSLGHSMTGVTISLVERETSRELPRPSVQPAARELEPLVPRGTELKLVAQPFREQHDTASLLHGPQNPGRLRLPAPPGARRPVSFHSLICSQTQSFRKELLSHRCSPGNTKDQCIEPEFGP